MPEIIAAGHISLDIIPQIPAASAQTDSFLAPGRLVESGALAFTPGGSVCNTGIALHILGADVRLVARVGRDRLAALTLDVISAYDPALAAHLVTDAQAPSCYTIVLNPPGIDRTFLHCPGANNNFCAEDLPEDLLRSARILHFGYPPLMRRMYAGHGAELVEMLARAQGCGLTTSLDMAMPDPAQPAGQADWSAILTRALPYVDLFVPSAEELLYMLDRPTFAALTRAHGPAGMIAALSPELIESLAQQALQAGAKLVLIKIGHRGVYLRTADRPIEGRGAPGMPSAWLRRQVWAPAFDVEVSGTVGAGDATIAGFLTALLRGQGPLAAVNAAAAVGACSVEHPDAASAVRSWDATLHRISAGWQRLACGVEDAAGWRRIALGVFAGPSDQRNQG